MKLSQLKIDPEFQSKIPPLQFEEEQQLEQNIIAEGRLLNPIITWNGYILDGHTRYIDRCNCYHPDGKEEKPAHPCAGGFQPGL